MADSISSPLAKSVIAKIRRQGYHVKWTRLPRRKRAADKFSDLPGLMLTAEPRLPGKRSVAVSVRDWSLERREVEAAMLLDHKLKRRAA